MTTYDLLSYYDQLLPAQYRSQPKAVATIDTLAALALMPQGGNVVVDNEGDPTFDSHGNVITDSPFGEILPLAVSEAFDIKTAEGQQLQFIGESIGAKNQGYNLSGQYVVLSDSDYRLLLQAAGAKNFLRATLPQIVKFMVQFFTGIMTVTDLRFMHMSFTYLQPLGSLPWAELFITQGFLPIPLGVGYSLIKPTVPTGPFFGFTSTVEPAPSTTVGFSTTLADTAGFVLNTTEKII